MKMLRLTLLMICATLVIPALAEADCTDICRDRYLYCLEVNCNGEFFCPSCEGYFMDCMDWCES